MTPFLSFLYGLLGGILAWAVTTFFGQPLVTFLRLRSECATELAQWREHQPHELTLELLHMRRAAYEKCGVNLIGFAASNQTFVRLARLFRVDPNRAGDNFVLLGQFGGDAEQRKAKTEQRFKSVVSDLKLKFDTPSDTPA